MAIGNRARAPRRVLIVLLGAIGDVIRALPLLGRIRRAWPDAYIGWAVEPKSEPILRGHRWVNKLIIYDRRHAPWSFVPFLQKIHSEQPRMRLKLLQYQTFADALDLAPAPVEFGLELPPAEDSRARGLVAGVPRPMMGVILGSSWPSRIYFAESIAEVIRGLASPVEGSAALFPVLLGGPDEERLAASIIDHLGQLPALNLAGHTGLRDLIGIFAECAVAFGPDSGPMHLAAAVGCPVVSLWGSTSPERSAPWGFADLAIHAEIPCHPCYLRECPIGRECMRRISPETVVNTVRRALNARPSLGAEALANIRPYGQ
jgi:ADP-heptose:LPS heptosyltransferase